MTSPSVPQSPSEDDEFAPSYINKDGRFRIPPDLMKAIGWTIEPSLGATFELVDGGFVRLWPAARYDDEFARVAGKPTAIAALQRILRRGSWESDNRLNPPPKSVRAFVLETGDLHGLIYVRLGDGFFDIIGHAHRVRMLANDRDAAEL